MCMAYDNPKYHPDTGLRQPWLTKPGNETLTEGLSVALRSCAGPRAAGQGCVQWKAVCGHVESQEVRTTGDTATPVSSSARVHS